jgi:hypothetical protein
LAKGTLRYARDRAGKRCKRLKIECLPTGSRPGVIGLDFEFASDLQQPFADFEVCCSSGKSVTALRVSEKVLRQFTEQVRIVLAVFCHGEDLIRIGYLKDLIAVLGQLIDFGLQFGDAGVMLLALRRGSLDVQLS